jgi:hypothetical protein
MRTATTRRNSFSATIVACYALIAFQFAAGVTASQATLTGTVSCAQCHGIHSRKGNTQLSCTILCVGQSSHYILIIGDKAYSLLGDKGQLQHFAGGPAIVTGHMDGDKIEVSSIGPVAPS